VGVRLFERKEAVELGVDPLLGMESEEPLLVLRPLKLEVLDIVIFISCQLGIVLFFLGSLVKASHVKIVL
jgi:hypothetical protein